MSRFDSNASSPSLIAGVVGAAMLICPAIAENIPDFAPDSRTGWIAGVPDGVSALLQRPVRSRQRRA
jgi:hypothetical protein